MRHCGSSRPTPSTTRRAKTPDALLDLYRTLTEWSTAVAGAGATSRSSSDSTPPPLERDGIPYEFVKDRTALAVDEGRAAAFVAAFVTVRRM